MRWIVLALGCLAAVPAAADPTAIAKVQSEKFERAYNAGDVPAMLALYADDASAVFPGAGDTATGRSAIEALLAREAAASPHQTIHLVSQDAHPLGEDYIATVGRWESTAPGPDGKPVTTPIRTTEVLVRHDGKWLYLVDHASIGAVAPVTP